MNHHEMQMLGFEIVAYAGDARSKILSLISDVEKGISTDINTVMNEVNNLINHAHKLQMELLACEARGEDLSYSLTMVHAQDHLMNVITLKELSKHIINLYLK